MARVSKASVVLTGLAGLVFFWNQGGKAEPFEPHVVVSVASYNELKNDLRYVGGVLGNPQWADILEGLILLNTRGQFPQVWDQTRRWGVAIQLDPESILLGTQMPEASAVVFILPVTNLKQFLTSVEGLLGVAESVEPGIFRVFPPEGEPLYFKQQNRWVVATTKQGILASVPSDPSTLLAGVGKEHDLAIQVNFGRFPVELQDHLAKQLTEAIDSQVERALAESEELVAGSKQGTEWILRQVSSYYGDLDQLVLGLNIDRESEKLAVEFAMTATPGSVGAKLGDRLIATQSRFLGLGEQDASVTVRFSAPIGDTLAWEVERELQNLRRQSLEAIAKETSKEKAQSARNFTNKLLDLMIDILAKSNVEVAFAMWSTPGKAGAILAAETTDVRKVNDFLQVVEELVSKEPDLHAVIRPEVEQVDGVVLHQVLVRVPSNIPERDEIVRLFGQDEIELVAAVGNQIMILGMGPGTTERIKALVRSAGAPKKAEGNVLALQTELLSLATFSEHFSAEASQREEAARLAAVLKEVGEPVRLEFFVGAIPRGLRFRFQTDGAILKILPVLLQSQAGPRLPISPPFGPAPGLPVPGLPAPSAPRF
jgi:hypothetical protein